MSALAATGWAAGVVAFFIVMVGVVAKLRPGSAYDVVTGFACQAIAYLLGLFLILRVHAPDAGIRDFVGMRSTHPIFYPLAILLGVAIEVPANALYIAIEHRWPSHLEDHFSDVFMDASAQKRAIMALIIILFGPMLEEIFFRGALFRPMRKSHPPVVVVLVTATLFALAHQAYQVLLPIFLIGLALGTLRWASASIVPTILFHATFNAMPFYSMAARIRTGAPESDAPIAPWIVAAGSIASLVLVVCVYLVGTRSADARAAQELDRR